MIKFIYQNKNRDNQYDKHWEFCCKNRLPFIRIFREGVKYCRIDYDMFPIAQLQYISIIDYSEHVISFYKNYKEKSNLPDNIFSYLGGGRYLMFKIYKSDAPEIADKLFDLLVELAEKEKN